LAVDMQRFLTTSFIALTLFISAAGAAPAAQAQGALLDTSNTPSCPEGQIEGLGAQAGQCFDAGGNATGETTVSVSGAKQPTDPNLGKTAEEGFGKIMIWIMSLFAWLVGVAALTLDYAVYYTVVNMGNYLHDLTAIGVAWRILRDLGNILLIFGFLASGIMIILSVDRYGYGRKLLPKLLIAAVFINFSLFASEAVIDSGNLLATQFYTQINGGQVPTSNFLSATTPSTEGISNKIMGQLGLQTIYTAGRVNPDVYKAGNTWIIGFMGIILFMITAFVMFSLAFVLIARFVYLIYLIIVSPVRVAGFSIPALEGRSHEWLSNLLHQTFIAPILFLLLYVALAVITDANFLTGTGNWVGFVEGNDYAGFAGMVLSFLVAMGLLLYVVYKAKDLGAIGAAGATKLAGKLTFGATAWGLNRTVGRGAYYLGRGLRQSKTFNKVNAATGRVMSRTLDRTATSSFDVRGVKLGGGLKKIVDAGAAREGGFTEARKQNIKAHEEEVKRIEEAHKDAFKQTPDNLKTITEAETEHKKTKDVRDALKTEVDRLAAIDTADRNAGRPSTVGSDLRDARQKLATSQENFKTATGNLAKAAGALKGAEDRMKENMKANKIAYAEGIDHPLNPITFVAYGPGTGAAARKIKNSLKDKSTGEKLLDDIKKLTKEIEETEKKEKAGGGESEEKAEKKPETETK